MDDVFLKYRQTELSENQQFRNFLVKWNIAAHNSFVVQHQKLSLNMCDIKILNKCIFGKNLIEKIKKQLLGFL